MARSDSKDARIRAQEAARGWHRTALPHVPDAKEYEHLRRLRSQFSSDT